MRRILLLILLCTPAFGTIAIAHRYNCAGSGACNATSKTVTITSTTSGNNFYVFTDSSTVPTGVAFGASGNSLTKQLCMPDSTITNLCFWYYENMGSGASGKTTFIITLSSGTEFSVHAWEVSGAEASNSIDSWAWCHDNSGVVCNEPTSKLFYTPSYSAEALLYAGNCTGSVNSPFVTASGVTITAAGPAGEPAADGIVSSLSQISMTADSGCGGNGGIIFGIRQLSATQTCAWNLGSYDYGTELGSSSNPTTTALISHTGSLIAVAVWGISGITSSGVTIGTDNATQTTVSGNSSATTGQPFIWYDLSSGVSGSQTITATISGTRTHSQVAYIEFIPGYNCTASHGVDSSLGTGNGTAINTPSITATSGSLLYNFTISAAHVTAFNSPWTCNNYTGSGETESCFFNTSVNGQAYSLSASGSAQANNATQLTGDWQALLTEFKLSGPVGGSVRRRASVINK